MVIYGQLDDLNSYTNACRTNWAMGARMKKNNEEIVSWHILQQRIQPVSGSVKLVFRWYESNRKRDVDNIAFSKKFILDSLVRNGIIENDNQRIVQGFTDEFYVDRERPRVEVEIVSVEQCQ